MLDKELIVALIREIAGAENLKVDEPMKNHTSFKVGGPADILVTPGNAGDLGKILKICRTEGIPFFIMGNGTNLIVRDKGIRGVVIKLFDNFNEYTVENDIIKAKAGILLSKISNAALTHGLAGLEFAAGIPGTLGGAVAMNAGAYGSEMSDVVFRTKFMDKNGEIRIIEGGQHQFAYRTSFIQKEDGIVLESGLKLRKSGRSEIKSLMDDLNKRRRDKQPLELPSAGSIFKRPEGHFAPRLIEDCGLKGYRIGGAEVSCKHCGFIVNTGNAAADDIIGLIKHIQAGVKLKSGVELEPEVRIIGEE